MSILGREPGRPGKLTCISKLWRNVTVNLTKCPVDEFEPTPVNQMYIKEKQSQEYVNLRMMVYSAMYDKNIKLPAVYNGHHGDDNRQRNNSRHGNDNKQIGASTERTITHKIIVQK